MLPKPLKNKIPGRTAASVTQLTLIKDVTPEIAKQVREVWHTARTHQEARAQIARLIGTHGVEFLGIHKRNNCAVYYCNSGETYRKTVCFVGLRLVVCCYGDFLDPRELVREPTFRD